MDIAQLLENNLERTITRCSYKKYDNNIETLEFLNKRLGISLKCISKHIRKSEASCHFYLNGINKLSERTKLKIDEFLSFVLKELNRKIDLNKELLTVSKYSELKQLVKTGETLLKVNSKTRSKLDNMAKQHQKNIVSKPLLVAGQRRSSLSV